MSPLLRSVPLAALLAIGASCASEPEVGGAPAAGADVVLQGWPAGQAGEIRFYRNATGGDNLLARFVVDGSGRFRYALGAPEGLRLFDGTYVTITPPDARWQNLLHIKTRLAGEDTDTGTVTIGNRFLVAPVEPGDAGAELWYVDRDVHIAGTGPDGCTYDQRLRAGWNFALKTLAATSPACAFTAATSLPAGLGWHHLRDEPVDSPL